MVCGGTECWGADGARPSVDNWGCVYGRNGGGDVIRGTECWGADGACPSVDNWGYVYGRNGSGNVIR